MTGTRVDCELASTLQQARNCNILCNKFASANDGDKLNGKINEAVCV